MIFQAFKRENYAANLIVFFLSVYVLINPLPHTTTIQGICLYASLLLFLGMRGSKAVKVFHGKTPLFFPTILFVSWILLGVLFAVDRQNSMHDIYAHVFRYIILCILFVNVFFTRNRVRFLSGVILFSVVSFVIYSLVDFYVVRGNGIEERFFGNSHGMTYNLVSIPIIFSFFLVLCNLLIAKKKYFRPLYILLLVPLVSALVLTQARSAFIALVISSVTFLLFYRKNLIPIIVVIFAAIFIFTPFKDRFSGNITTNLRLNHNLLVLEVVKDYPLAGIGFGMETFGYSLDLNSYKNKLERTYNTQYGQEVVLIDPHNMYTDILVRTGLPGFVLYLWFILALFRMLLKIRRSEDIFLRAWSLGVASSLVAYCIIGFFEPVFSHVHEFYFALMVSLAAILWKQHSPESANFPRNQ